MSASRTDIRQDEGKAERVPRAARIRALGVLLFAAVAIGGCFRYVVVQPATLRDGENVQVRISDPAATRLISEFGMFTGQLEGQYAHEGPDSLSISVLISRDYRGMSLDQVRQRLFLGRSEVIEVRRRQLSRARTAVATVGVLVGFAGLVAAVIQEGDPNPNDDDPPPPPPGGSRYRVLIRIPIR